MRDLRGRQEQIRQLEQDMDALLEHYAGIVPEALDELNAAERHYVHEILQIEASVAPDGSLDASGDVINVREMELLSL